MRLPVCLNSLAGCDVGIHSCRRWERLCNRYKCRLLAIVRIYPDGSQKSPVLIAQSLWYAVDLFCCYSCDHSNPEFCNAITLLSTITVHELST